MDLRLELFLALFIAPLALASYFQTVAQRMHLIDEPHQVYLFLVMNPAHMKHAYLSFFFWLVYLVSFRIDDYINEGLTTIDYLLIVTVPFLFYLVVIRNTHITISLTPESISEHSRKGTTKIYWQDIDKLETSAGLPLLNETMLSTKAGRTTIRFSFHNSDMPEIYKFVREVLPQEKHQLLNGFKYRPFLEKTLSNDSV